MIEVKVINYGTQSVIKNSLIHKRQTWSCSTWFLCWSWRRNWKLTEEIILGLTAWQLIDHLSITFCHHEAPRKSFIALQMLFKIWTLNLLQNLSNRLDYAVYLLYLHITTKREPINSHFQNINPAKIFGWLLYVNEAFYSILAFSQGELSFLQNLYSTNIQQWG